MNIRLPSHSCVEPAHHEFLISSYVIVQQCLILSRRHPWFCMHMDNLCDSHVIFSFEKDAGKCVARDESCVLSWLHTLTRILHFSFFLGFRIFHAPRENLSRDKGPHLSVHTAEISAYGHSQVWHLSIST